MTQAVVSIPQQALATAEGARDRLRDRLELARQALEDLRTTIDKERDAYRAALAGAELAGAPTPDRSTLAGLQARVPEAEDLVAALERAHGDADAAWRAAQAEVLDEQAVAIDAETRERQARMHELQGQIDVLLHEQGEHAVWIANQGPTAAQQLRARARELRRKA